jgi:hypothetical protein
MASPSASSPAPAQRSDAPRTSRPSELEDSLNRFIYHPLAHRLAVALRPTGITPNAVSIVGGLLVLAAAWAYTALSWPQSALLGFSFHLLWHVVDGADGDLARLTGKASPIGEMVDGACDYVSHAILYVALAAFLDDQIGGWAWALGSIAGVSHVLQANHAESQRRTYLWWAYGVPWLKHAEASGDQLFKEHWFSRLLGWPARAYIRLSQAMSPHTDRIDAAAEAALNDPRQSRRLRALVRRASRQSLVLEKLVGPNPKTIILGISMALGSPLYFFLAETLLLNLLLVYSVWHHNVCNRRLAGMLGR